MSITTTRNGPAAIPLTTALSTSRPIGFASTTLRTVPPTMPTREQRVEDGRATRTAVEPPRPVEQTRESGGPGGREDRHGEDPGADEPGSEEVARGAPGDRLERLRCLGRTGDGLALDPEGRRRSGHDSEHHDHREGHAHDDVDAAVAELAACALRASAVQCRRVVPRKALRSQLLDAVSALPEEEIGGDARREHSHDEREVGRFETELVSRQGRPD